MGRRGKQLFSLAFTVALLTVVYASVDAGAVVAALRQARPGWLLISVGLIVPLTLLRAARFLWIAPAGALPGFAEALRLTLVASAFNIVAPAKAGDFTKSLFVARSGGATTGVAVALVVYERIADLTGLFFWCLAAGLVWRDQVVSVPAVMWIVFAAGGVAGAVLALSTSVARLLPAPFRKLAASMPRLRKLSELAGGWPDLHAALGARRWWIVLFSVFLWLVQLTQIGLFAVTLSIDAPFAICITYGALALMAGQLPITIGGIGARDLTLVALLGGYSTPETVAAMGVLTATRTLLPPLAGLLILRPYLAAVVSTGQGWRRH